MLRVKRLRLGKMQCNMGIIKIGGFGVAHLKNRKDAIEDATRACEVAYQDGYIADGSLAIPFAIKDVHNNIKSSDLGIDEKDKDLIGDFLDLFEDAFLGVSRTLFGNKFDDPDRVELITSECLRLRKSYNLITDEYTDELITPVDVCKEVLNGCMRLVLINATSNQFVFMNEDELLRAIQKGSIADDEYKEKNEDSKE